MQVVVTGGAGFIGYNLCLKLQQLDWTTHVVDDYSSGHQSNKVSGVIYYNQTILNKDFINHLIDKVKPEVVFHLAAIPRVAYSVEHPLETAQANVIGTINLLEAIRKLSPDTKFVYSSSSSVYGGADQLPTPESYALNPKSPYALEKAQGEEWCRMYSRVYGLNTVCLRYFNVFGKFSRYGGPYTTVLGAWLYSLFVDKTVRPYLEGDGTVTRDFCWVGNVVQANVTAAIHPSKFSGEAFNIAHGERHSLLECKSILEEISGETLDLEIRPPRVGDVDHTLADISAAKEKLGYKPVVDFRTQVEEMAEWYKVEYAKEVAASKIQQGH